MFATYATVFDNVSHINSEWGQKYTGCQEWRDVASCMHCIW